MNKTLLYTEVSVKDVRFRVDMFSGYHITNLYCININSFAGPLFALSGSIAAFQEI
jgi:hypothetical protein